MGLGTCGSSYGSPYGMAAVSPAPAPWQGRRGSSIWSCSPRDSSGLGRGSPPSHQRDQRMTLPPAVACWHLAAVLPHLSWPPLLGPRSHLGKEATSPKEELTRAATKMALHANSTPAPPSPGTYNCLTTPSRASRVSHPSHGPGFVQPGWSAAVITWEQKPCANELISKAEPFATGGWVNNTIYREMP